MTSYRAVLIDTEKHLPTTPETVREIHRRMDCWADNSIRHALRALVDTGKAECVREPGPSGTWRWRYWRKV